MKAFRNPNGNLTLDEYSRLIANELYIRYNSATDNDFDSTERRALELAHKVGQRWTTTSANFYHRRKQENNNALAS